MALRKKKAEPVIKEVEVDEAVVVPHVVEHVERDPNDPRNWPVVDGNDLPKVDINEPL